MTDAPADKWPLARIGKYRGWILAVRAGQGSRRPKDGFFAFNGGVTGPALRAPQLYALRRLVSGDR